MQRAAFLEELKEARLCLEALRLVREPCMCL